MIQRDCKTTVYFNYIDSCRKINIGIHYVSEKDNSWHCLKPTAAAATQTGVGSELTCFEITLILPVFSLMKFCFSKLSNLSKTLKRTEYAEEVH